MPYLNMCAIHRVVSDAIWAPNLAAWVLSNLPNNAATLWDRIAALAAESVGNNGGSALSLVGSELCTNSSKFFKIFSMEVASGSKKPALILRISGFETSPLVSWALTPASRRPTTSDTWNSSPPKGLWSFERWKKNVRKFKLNLGCAGRFIYHCESDFGLRGRFAGLHIRCCSISHVTWLTFRKSTTPTWKIL